MTIEKRRPAGHIILTVLIIMIGLFYCTAAAFAVSVPAVTVDPGCTAVEGDDPAVITGTVTVSKGQSLVMYASDQYTVLKKIRLKDTGGSCSYSLTIPERGLLRPGKTAVYLKCLQAKGVTASPMVKITVCAMGSQSIAAPSEVVLTNLNKTAVLNASASSGLALKYSSSDPDVVSVSASGKLKRMKNGNAVITILQEGNDIYHAASGQVKVTSRKSTRKEQIDAAVNWAVKIAGDNSFAYGSGSDAHHNGCYFCGTNYGPRKYMKPSKRYRKTYCCNPFVHAAYAHGAKHPKMLTGCRSASGIGMEKSTFYQFKCWKCVGKPAYKDLQKGDVLVKYNHVAMYIGQGKLVEASGGGWDAGSIAVKKMSHSRYGEFSYVMRYTGY